MPILCHFVSRKQRATAYGVMNMIGVSAGAFITHLLGRWGDSGNLGIRFCHASHRGGYCSWRTVIFLTS